MLQAGRTPSRPPCCSTATFLTSHLPLYRDAQNYKTDFSAIIPGLGPQLLEGAPTLSITNITSITEAGSKNFEQTYQGNTAVTKILPKHTIKAGASYLFNDSWQDSSTSHGGFNFTGRYSGIAYADFLLGLPNTTSNATPHDYIVRFNSSQYAGYAQDDWKAASEPHHQLRHSLTISRSSTTTRMAPSHFLCPASARLLSSAMRIRPSPILSTRRTRFLRLP